MFKKIKEIISKDGKLHFRRWNIISTPWFRIYFHAIYQPDEDKHLHNHPWKFWSLVLKGAYTERLTGFKLNPRLAGTSVYRNTDQFHKIDDLHSPVVYTLNVLWGFTDSWGYLVNDKFVNNETYRQWKNEGRFK